LQSLCKRLVSGEPVAGPRAPAPTVRVGAAAVVSTPAVVYPEFPSEGEGSKTRYWLHVVGWAFRSAWIFFNQLPRWIRAIVYVWLCVALLSKGCSSDERHSSKISPHEQEQLHAISEKYHGNFDKKDISQLASQIARLTSDNTPEVPAERSPLLAIPFTAPPGNADAAKVADSTFALVYGKVAVAHRGQVGLSQESASCDDSKAAQERGRANHSAYVLCGAVGTQAAAQVLTIKISKVSDGSVVWTQSYPVAGADPAKIAEEVNSHVPELDDDN
jgi:TolB-like protein